LYLYHSTIDPVSIPYPQGFRIAAPVVCSVLGMFFFICAAYRCQTFEVDTTQVHTGQNMGFSASRIGFWSFEDHSKDCRSYPDGFDPDGPMKFGRAIGILGSILGLTLVVMLLVASCLRYPARRMVFGAMGGCMILMAVFALLLFVGLSSNPFDMDGWDLKVGNTGWRIIPSAFFWLAAAFATLFTMKEREVTGVAPTTTTPLDMPDELDQKAAAAADPEVQDVTN